MTDIQKRKMERLIDKVYDGFQHYVETLEDSDDFESPMNRLVSYIEEITKTKLFETKDGIDKLYDIIEYYEDETEFEHGRIEVSSVDSDRYEIYIDGSLYSNYLTAEEVEDTIKCIFKGIRLMTQ
jgi:hypothetical protein